MKVVKENALNQIIFAQLSAETLIGIYSYKSGEKAEYLDSKFPEKVKILCW